MCKPHYYDKIVDAMKDLREFEICCTTAGYLVIKCLLDDLNDAQELCDKLGMHPDDYHIETC